MTAIDTPIIHSIQQALAIIQQGRALERLLIDAGFSLTPTDATPTEAPTQEEAPPLPVEPDTADWPQEDPDTGELMDARGLPWIEGAHSAGKTCNDDGSWRRRRGVDPETVARLETQARLESMPEVAADPEPDETLLPGDVSEFDRIRAGIASAANQGEIDYWVEHSQFVIITASQRIALQSCAEERARAFG